MLKSLTVSNVAVIKELSLDLEGGFTVITGETGAGKSVIIDSIAFALGEKGSKDMIRTGESRSEVTALFSELSEKREYLEEIGAPPDENGELLISRTLTQDGKSAVKINGKSVSVSLLKMAAATLLTIHGQKDSGILSEKGELRALLDRYISNDKELADFEKIYKELCECEKKLERLKASLSDREMMLDILKYQIKEIESARLSDVEEEEKLLRLREKLRSIEKITKNVSVVKRALLDNEKGVSASYMLERASSAVRALDGVIEGAEEIASRLDALRYELSDIAERVEDESSIDGGEDPERRLDLVEKRLTIIRKATKKYGPEISDVIEKHAELAQRLKELESVEVATEDLERQIEELKMKAAAAASSISKKRNDASTVLNEKISAVLRELDMPKVTFCIKVQPRHDGKGGYVFDSFGYDDVDFYVSPNIGEDMLPISKIASGGELSRIMLAIKSCMLVKSGEGTSVFDEIDAGVSGATSERIGLKLRDMSKSAQVICITHSAQIASLADCHIKISKHETNGRVESFVTPLDRDGRVKELSRIIGGINITEKQVRAAVEMLEKAKIKM